MKLRKEQHNGLTLLRSRMSHVTCNFHISELLKSLEELTPLRPCEKRVLLMEPSCLIKDPSVTRHGSRILTVLTICDTGGQVTWYPGVRRTDMSGYHSEARRWSIRPMKQSKTPAFFHLVFIGPFRESASQIHASGKDEPSFYGALRTAILNYCSPRSLIS